MSLFSKERKKLFFGDERFNDVTFEFCDTSETLGANKTILSLESPVFEAMFFGPFADTSKTITIRGISYETFKKFLHALYHEDLVVTSLEEVEEIFFPANYYQVSCIESAFEKYFIKNLKKIGLVDAVEISKTYGLKELEYISKMLIENNPNRHIPCRWITIKKEDPIPSNFFIAGCDSEGYPLGVGRFRVIDDIVPGTFSVREKCVRVESNSFSYTNFDNFEILCDGNAEWVRAKNRVVPDNSINGGRTKYGDRLHVAMCIHEGVTVIGKVRSRYNRTAFPWEKGELEKLENIMTFPWKERGLEKREDFWYLIDREPKTGLYLGLRNF